MVFRGKPSRACERCRARRLRCDLGSDSCGQCVRASVPCSGYRDTLQLRIRDESESVVRKALKDVPPFRTQSLPLSIDFKARNAFFAYHAPSTSKYWDFLKQYYHSTDSPNHLTLAIEAVSLAYLWHQTYSDAALATARKRYVSALRITNKALASSKEVKKDSTLLVTLLLDLFEKITTSKSPSDKSWTSHINGGLTLVRLRGLDAFQDPASAHVLVRLSTNYVTSCVASSSPVFDELIAIRAFAGKFRDVQDPHWRLSGLMVKYANLRSSIRRCNLSDEEYVELSRELDSELKLLDLDMPPSWQYSTTFLDRKSERAFLLYFDSYPDRHISQGRNGLRVIRILLNEYLLEHRLAIPTGEQYLESIREVHNNILSLACEICACAPQYLDCDGAARQRLPTSEQSQFSVQEHRRTDHPHTPKHQLDCYTLIFPIYVAGRSNIVPGIRSWVIKQLHYMSSHFCLRSAEVVAQILEGEMDVCPWEVYTMLGSYAFAA